jgi:hypothetical protein
MKILYNFSLISNIKTQEYYVITQYNFHSKPRFGFGTFYIYRSGNRGGNGEERAKYGVRLLKEMDENLFVSKYLVNLPDKKLLENFMNRELER